MFALCGAALIAIGAFASTYMFGAPQEDERRAFQTALTLSVVIVPALVFFWLAKRPLRAIAAACITMIAFNLVVRQHILPEARDVLVSQDASNALLRAGLHPRLTPGAGRLTSVGFNEPSFVFLTRTDTLLAAGEEASAKIAPGGVAIVEGRQREAFERGLAARGLRFAPLGAPVAGLNYSNGDDVSLQPGRVTPDGSPSSP
jgi:hypothetical protein